MQSTNDTTDERRKEEATSKETLEDVEKNEKLPETTPKDTGTTLPDPEGDFDSNSSRADDTGPM
jgi:hypothetical protein